MASHHPPPTNHRPKYPTEHGWLVADLKHEAAFYRTKLEDLLAEPGVAELLAAIPQIHRILNPIRSALALPTHLPRHIPRRHPAPPLKTDLSGLADSCPNCCC